MAIVYRCWPKIGIVYKSENPPVASQNVSEPVNWNFARALARAHHDETERAPISAENLYTIPTFDHDLYTIPTFDHR